MQMEANVSNASDQIIALERQALDRWGRGDPSGFLEISAPDVVYFDPFLAHRLDGRDALLEYYEGLRGKISVESYELLNPLVQECRGVAVLTFNLVCRTSIGAEMLWNSTEVYRREDAGWRIIQSHWSKTNHGQL
jgi:hypothetical protein